MKATGVVRRIDELGRIVIPKEIRRTMRLRDGDPLEIFIDRDGSVILKKYSPIAELGGFAKEYAESLANASGHSICITDNDQIIAIAGGMKRDCVGRSITMSLEDVIGRRKNVINNASDGEYVNIFDSQEEKRSQVISPILCEGDAIGAVVLVGKTDDVVMGEMEQVLAKCAADFMGRQMEM
ncbi:MAG: stage V sporulation protein T [Firmicutes bacterium]|nr:stage V sporulation protein T [Bacillota bacterium]